MTALSRNVKNVLHLIETWGPGGAETICLELATGLDAVRFGAVVAVVREGWVSDALRQRGLDPVIVRAGRGPVDLRFLTGLARVVRRHRIDLIQSHLLGANLYASVLGRFLGIPTFCTFHGSVDVGQNDRFAGLKLKTIAACAQRMIFVSEALRRHVIGSLAISTARTAVIHNGVDTERFIPRRSAVLRGELGLRADHVLVGAIGNIRPAKAYDLLLHVAVACSVDPRLRFVVIGEGHERLSGELQELHRTLQHGDRVRFLGFRENVDELFNGLDIYLNTSRSEGFSLSTVQAMACGIPVVATRSGGPEEIVTDGVDGLLCAVDDVRGIAAAVQSLANEPALRARLVAAGRQTVLTRFTLGRMVEAYTALYDAVPSRSA